METLAERRVSYEHNADQMFGAISGLSAFIMMFSILSMMNTLITNIGMSRGQVRKMLLGESLLLAAAAVGVTMTIGTFCGYMLSSILYKMGAFYMEFRFPTAFVLAYGGILIAVPLLIAFVSMHSFSKESLVERLRGTEC